MSAARSGATPQASAILTMPSRTRAPRASTIGRIPRLRPLSIAIGNCPVAPSSSNLRTAGLLSSTSRAAVRPPPPPSARVPVRRRREGHRQEMRGAAGGDRRGKHRPAARGRRALGAEIDPYEAARTRRVERGAERTAARRSSITSTSAPSRRAARAADAIASPSPRTSRWLMNEHRRSCLTRDPRLDRDHVFVPGAIDHVHERVEHGRLAAGARPGDHDQTIGGGAESAHLGMSPISSAVLTSAAGKCTMSPAPD